MKVYITKYALSTGIKEIEAETTSISDKMVCERQSGRMSQCYHKPYWHLTIYEATAHAEQMRVAKIASLQKQIKKLEAGTL